MFAEKNPATSKTIFMKSSQMKYPNYIKRENNMKKYKQIVLVVLILFMGSFFGFKPSNGGITDFYYYQGKPFKLILKSNAIFIELNNNVSSNSFQQMLSDFPEIMPRPNGHRDHPDVSRRTGGTVVTRQPV